MGESINTKWHSCKNQIMKLINNYALLKNAFKNFHSRSNLVFSFVENPNESRKKPERNILLSR